MAGPAKEQNPWMGLMDADELQKNLVQNGMEAIQNGTITPEQAMANFQSVNPVLKAAGVQVFDVPLSVRGSGKPTTPSAAKADMAAAMDADSADPGLTSAKMSKLPQVTQKPVARGSGMTELEEFKENALKKFDNMNKTQGQYLLSMDPEQLQDLYGRTEKLPVFQEQAKGIQRMRDMLAMETGASSDFISGPLAGLLETEFGRKVPTMASMRGPSPQDQRAKILGYMQKIQDDQRDLGKGIFDAISKQKAGSFTESTGLTNSISDQTTATKSAKAEDPRRFDQAPKGPNPFQMRLNLFREFQKDTKGDREGLYAAQNAISALNSGSAIADQAVQVMLGRASGDVGALSNQDVARYAGSKALGERVQQALTLWETGRLTEANRADLVLVAQTYERFRKDLLKQKSKFYTEQVGPAIGVDSQIANTLVMPGDGYGVSKDKIYPKAAQEKVGGGTIKVIGPNGVKGTIPASKWEAAQKRGYKKAE